MPQANPKKDYYKILGVSEDADQEEIKKAYKELAKKYHPDRSDEPESEEKFKEIGEAYAVLKDPEKRKKYDQFRKYGRSPGTDGFQFDSDGFDFFDLFQQATGPRRGRGKSGHGSGGGAEQIFGEMFGGPSGKGPGGQENIQFNFGGAGAGKQGVGFNPQQQSRKKQHQKHEITRRIPFKLAFLGGKLKVKTPKGNTVKLDIGSGTQPGTKLKIPNQGPGGDDLLVNLEIKIPENPSEEQREAVRKYF